MPTPPTRPRLSLIWNRIRTGSRAEARQKLHIWGRHFAWYHHACPPEAACQHPREQDPPRHLLATIGGGK